MDNDYKIFSGFQSGLFSGLTDLSLKVDTTKPVNKTQVIEAKENGLLLLSKSSSINYNYYQHLGCKHTSFYQPTHVRRGNVQCKTCLLLKYAEDAYNNSHTLLHTTGKAKQLYRKPCGHLVNSSPQNIRKSANSKCLQCFEEDLTEAANRNGYNYKGVVERGNVYRVIEFKDCGHEKILQHSQIFKGNAVCRVCEAIERKELAEGCGLFEISEVDNRYFKYLLPCGHDKVLRVDHAIAGSYTCDCCGDSYYQRKSYLYLFEFSYNNFTWLKLGFSSNPYLRKNNYGLPMNTECRLIIQIPFETGRSAMLVEKGIHNTLRKFKINKEVMQDYHTNNGYSECYNIQTKDEIIKTIKEVCSEFNSRIR